MRPNAPKIPAQSALLQPSSVRPHSREQPTNPVKWIFHDGAWFIAKHKAVQIAPTVVSAIAKLILSVIKYHTGRGAIVT